MTAIHHAPTADPLGRYHARVARPPYLSRSGRSIPSTLSAFRYGAGDPTTRLGQEDFWRATLTPDGAATVHIEWHGDAPIGEADLRIEAWGPGADWLVAQVPTMCGESDPGHHFHDAPAVLQRAQLNHPRMRIGASGLLYHELLPTILGQRVTAGEALAQWRHLVLQLGSPAPGPCEGLLLPPSPDVLAGRPAWWFHPLGIETKRAQALSEVARHPQRLFDWAQLPPTEAAAKLALLPGIGQWTIGSVLGTALGDPDSIAVGDYHLKNLVVHAFTGRARGTDEEMLALLATFAGQRGRVVRLLQLDGHSSPVFGPHRRVLPTDRW